MNRVIVLRWTPPNERAWLADLEGEPLWPNGSSDDRSCAACLPCGLIAISYI
jgi:hypothetical protein